MPILSTINIFCSNVTAFSMAEAIMERVSSGVKAGGKSPKNNCINAFLTGGFSVEKASCTRERNVSNASFFHCSEAGGRSSLDSN